MIDNYKHANVQIIGIQTQGAGTVHVVNTFRRYTNVNTEESIYINKFIQLEKFRTEIMNNPIITAIIHVCSTSHVQVTEKQDHIIDSNGCGAVGAQQRKV